MIARLAWMAPALMLALAGCAAQTRAERDVKVAAAADDFASAPVVPWDPATLCRQEMKPGKWLPLMFEAGMPRVALPNGYTTRAHCVKLSPGGTLKAITESRGGATYHSATTVFPSLMFLDAAYEPTEYGAFHTPAWYWKERWTGTGLNVDIVLGSRDKWPAYVVVYLDPEKFGRTVPVLSTGVGAGAGVVITTTMEFQVPVAAEGEARLKVE